MRINFRFRFWSYGVGISVWSRCIFVPNFLQIYLSSMRILEFYQIQYGRRPPSWIFYEVIEPPTKAHSCWLFRHDWLSIVQFISTWSFYRLHMKSYSWTQNFSLCGFTWLPRFMATSFRPPKGTSLHGMTRFNLSLIQTQCAM